MKSKKNLTLKIVRKGLILAVLCLGMGMLLLSDNSTEASMTACYDSYVACHAACDALDPQYQAACRSTCLFPYGNCVNQAQLDKQGELMNGYEEG